MALGKSLSKHQEIPEHVGIQKVWIHRACPQSKSWQVWELLDRDVVGDLEGETKIIRHLVTHSADPFLGWKSVVARIHTNRSIRLRIFSQAFSIKSGL